MLSDTLEKFKRFTKHPERYLQAQSDVAEEIKSVLKDVYDFTKKEESSSQTVKTLPELVIKDFDDEQIWQELELQNSMKCERFITDIPRLIASKVRLHIELLSNETETKSDYENGDSEEGLSSEDEDESLKQKQLEENKTKQKPKGCKIRPSIVDDQFFKLSELEEFLEREDRKENSKNRNKKRKDDSDDTESDVSVDYFGDIPSEDEEEEEGIRYNEFFDAPEDEGKGVEERMKRKRSNSEQEDVAEQTDNDDDSGEDEHEEQDEDLPEDKEEKQVRFDLSPASSTSNSGSENSDDEEDHGKNKDIELPKSNFEARQERLKARVKALEEKALAEKPWQLKGEVSAAARPENSLLEEVLEFDMTTRPAPVVTEQTTMKLEDIIRQRIKDKAWDDVERKVKPTLEPDEYKKRLVMNQEKSKLSLAEVYEQEYLKQKEAQDPDAEEKPEEEPEEHRVIRAMTSALFARLDALSNFHYTPKPVIPDIKIVSNLPAITMEEVAPVAASDATLLAPEEVKAKEKGDLMGKAERTKTDQKRERRLKKKTQRVRQKEKEKREKLVEKLRPGLGNKYSKERALETLKKVSKDKNVHQLEDQGKDKGVRSSTAFFTRLQEEVVSHIKGRTNEPKKKEKDTFSAKKMKL